jgi:hypothetical protein
MLLSAGLLALLSGCEQSVLYTQGEMGSPYQSPAEYGSGGYGPELTLPFRSGEYWMVTQGYNTGSHVDYGFSYGNDSLALDFSQSGCEAYGKDVTPILPGTVMRAEDKGDGYGNSVLIESADGYVARYGHFSEITASVGDRVDESDTIGKVGNTGYATGTACSDHPGTHLHLALYHDSDHNVVEPQPLSGTVVHVGCWYNREGEEDCSGNPGDYEPVSDDTHQNNEDEGDNEGTDDEEVIENDGDGLNVAYLEISPERGVNGETQYIWVSTIVSDDGRPDATLSIVNPNDGVTYDFDMDTESHESPWVFTTQKTLRDADTYEYWVTAEDGGRSDHSSEQHVRVDEGGGDLPGFLQYGETLYGREAEWSTLVESDDEPSVVLKIVNPADATIYSFDMDVEESGNDWHAHFNKELRDATVYTYWYEATNRDGTQNSDVQALETE